MKKLFYLLLIISVGNFSCSPICACSPAIADLYLAIRSSSGDLLNPKTSGYFSKDEIKLTLKSKTGSVEQKVNFSINPPIDYGDVKLSYYQLTVMEAISLTAKEFELYLTLGNRPPVLVKLFLRKDGRKFELLTIDGVDIKPEERFPINTLFYYTL